MPALARNHPAYPNKLVLMSTTEINLYIVETNNDNPRHRNATSPYLLTEMPDDGDKIKYILRGEKSITYEVGDDEDATLTELSGYARLLCMTNDQYASTGVKIISHPGRSPRLGEDGLEDAFGNDITQDLFVEILNNAGWRYAPCDIEITEELLEQRLKASLDPSGLVWTATNDPQTI